MTTERDSTVKMIAIFILTLSAALGVNSNNLANEFKCQTFADGSVYPTSTAESTNHKLQYTKALSEYNFDFLKLQRLLSRIISD